MQLKDIKRLRELKSLYQYEIAKLNSKEPSNDTELLHLLEVLNFQKQIVDSVNEFAQRDFVDETESIKIILGTLAHVSARVVTKAAAEFDMDESALIEMHHNLFEDTVLQSIGEEQ